MCTKDDLSFNVKTEQGYQYYAYKDSDCIVIDGIHRTVTASQEGPGMCVMSNKTVICTDLIWGV